METFPDEISSRACRVFYSTVRILFQMEGVKTSSMEKLHNVYLTLSSIRRKSFTEQQWHIQTCSRDVVSRDTLVHRF
ncbi:hypothetical protein ANTQUA_LOCUS3168 [Anthophora quadrimaculata]